MLFRSIEGNTESDALGGNALLKLLEVQRTATCVDVAAIGRSADGNDFAAQGFEKFGAELVGGAIGAIENDAKASKIRARNSAAAEKIQILMMERIVRHKLWQRGRGIFRLEFQNAGFNLFLHRIWEFHARVGEEFDAVIVIRIVRSGNDNANVKIVLADETSDARRGENPCKRNVGTAPRESCGQNSGDVRTGFASVHAN